MDKSHSDENEEALSIQILSWTSVGLVSQPARGYVENVPILATVTRSCHQSRTKYCSTHEKKAVGHPVSKDPVAVPSIDHLEAEDFFARPIMRQQ